MDNLRRLPSTNHFSPKLRPLDGRLLIRCPQACRLSPRQGRAELLVPARAASLSEIPKQPLRLRRTQPLSRDWRLPRSPLCQCFLQILGFLNRSAGVRSFLRRFPSLAGNEVRLVPSCSATLALGERASAIGSRKGNNERTWQLLKLQFIF